MPPYKALFFDWDGTLADSVGDIVAAIHYAHDQVGLPRTGDAQARGVIGLALRDALMRTAPPGISAQQLDALVYHYRRHYLAPERTTRLFAAARTWLPEWQKRYWLAVATGKSRAGLNRALQHTGTAGFFLATRTVDECLPKPNPDMVLSLCDELGLRPREVLVVGDTTHDLLMAANAGADAVAVASGAHGAEILRTVPQLAVLPDLAALAQWLDNPLTSQTDKT